VTVAEDAIKHHADEDDVAEAVRDYTRTHVLAILETKGLSDAPELETCGRCGERTIHPDVAASYAIDRRDRNRVCAACSAVADVLKIMVPRFEHDVGGEGEGGG
jgi:recombinational DNA repair protein (RecF pathway)